MQPENDHRKVCENCGALMVEYKHSLNEGLLAVLKGLAAAGGPVHLDELHLTNSQYSNSPKLRYWELAVHAPPENEVDQVKGCKWRLTRKGVDFLKRQIGVPKSVITYRNEVKRFEGSTIFVDDIEDGYQYRGDYRAQVLDQMDDGQMNLL